MKTKNLIAVIAVAMISSLAVAQAAGLNNSKTEREQRINDMISSNLIFY